MNVFKTSLVKVVLATTLICGVIAPAHAADSMAFDVTITINASCDVTSTEDVAFVSQTAAPGTATATGSVNVQCTKATAYNVALNAGNNGGTDINARKMKHATAADTIAYQLYRGSAAGGSWGTTANTDTVSGTGTGFGGTSFDHNHVVYAEATITGLEAAGAYSDIITATVLF